MTPGKKCRLDQPMHWQMVIFSRVLSHHKSYIHIYIYTYIYIHIYIYTYLYICIYICIYIYRYICFNNVIHTDFQWWAGAAHSHATGHPCCCVAGSGFEATSCLSMFFLEIYHGKHHHLINMSFRFFQYLYTYIHIYIYIYIQSLWTYTL